MKRQAWIENTVVGNKETKWREQFKDGDWFYVRGNPDVTMKLRRIGRSFYMEIYEKYEDKFYILKINEIPAAYKRINTYNEGPLIRIEI